MEATSIITSQIADLLGELYSGSTSQMDYVDWGTDDNGICWALKKTPSVDLILLRGSTTIEDWLRDFLAIALWFPHSKLGPVHPGFLVGMVECWREIRLKSSGPWIVAGHSLGAGRAAILSGLMKVDGVPPLKRVAFGEPKPGFQPLADFLADIPCENYRNGDTTHHDIITDVPLTFPPEEYVHSATMKYVTATPGDDIRARWGMFAWHHMPLYQQAVK